MASGDWATSASIYLFIEFEPGGVAETVSVLQSEEPNFSQTNGLDDLVEQHLAGGAELDGELQLRVHCRHANVDLLRHFRFVSGFLGESASEFRSEKNRISIW
jgi:hypothetical protein